MTVQITVIGLGQIGTSIGLALASQKANLSRLGHDREPLVARQAEKMGAFDRIDYNLPGAVSKADAVILAVPVDEIRETLESMAPDLKPGAVVIDTSPVKIGVAAWAQELLPADRHFISMTPSLNPLYLEGSDQSIDQARADLFQNSIMVLTNPPGADAAAIQLAVDLVVLLGARPFFSDPYEADGLMAASHLLPPLLAAALITATADQPGWQEGRKLAGRTYQLSTSALLSAHERARLGQAALLNRENTLRVLDNLMAALQNLRGYIAENDSEGLHKFIKHAQDERNRWWQARLKGEWDASPQRDAMPKAGDVFGRLFGFGKKH